MNLWTHYRGFYEMTHDRADFDEAANRSIRSWQRPEALAAEGEVAAVAEEPKVKYRMAKKLHGMKKELKKLKHEVKSLTKGEVKMDEKVIERVMTFLPQAQGMDTASLLALSKKEGGGFGEGGGGVLFLIVLLALLGRGGGGLLGGSNAPDAAVLAQNGVTRDDINALQNSLTSIREGQFAQTTALQQDINTTHDDLTRDISSLNSTNNMQFAQLTNTVTQGFAATAAEMARCCCDIQRNIDNSLNQTLRAVDASTASINATTQATTDRLADQATQNQFHNIRQFDELRYQAQTNKAETLAYIDKGNDRILAYMNAEKIDALQAELAACRLRESQTAQTAAILQAIASTCGGNGNGNSAAALAAIRAAV